jgi:hypothetical protein
MEIAMVLDLPEQVIRRQAFLFQRWLMLTWVEQLLASPSSLWLVYGA